MKRLIVAAALVAATILSFGHPFVTMDVKDMLPKGVIPTRLLA